jgi:hypothetical protein
VGEGVGLVGAFFGGGGGVGGWVRGGERWGGGSAGWGCVRGGDGA